MALKRIKLTRRYLAFLFVHRYAFAGMILCMMLSAFLEPMLSLVIKPLIDGNGGEFPLLREDVPYAILLLASSLAALLYGRTYLGGWLDVTIQKKLRVLMCSHLLKLSMSRLNDESMGVLTTRIMSFVPTLTSSTMPVFLALVQEPLKAIVYISIMIYLQWELALIILAATPFVSLIILILGRRMKKVARLTQEQTKHCQSALNEAVRLMPVLKIQGGQAAHEKLSGVFSALRGVMLRLSVVMSAAQPSAQIIAAVPISIVVFYAIKALDAGTMSPGDVASFIAVTLLLPRSVRAIARSGVVVEQMFAAATEVFGFLDTPPEVDEGTKDIIRCRGEVAFDNVTMCYANADKKALSDVSINIAAGETVALVGISGSGKTTLANLLPRFYSPMVGTVRLDGEDISEFKLDALRRQIALVTQEPLLIDDTVAANVAYPEDGNANPEKLRQALQDAAADFVTTLEHGVNTVVGESGNHLSGGQRQRLALARAFYRDAPIVVLDEATSSLDGETETKIKGAMSRLLMGRTALIIAHRFATIDFADRIIVLNEGRVQAQGTMAQLLKTSPLFAELYKSQKLA